MPALLPCHYQYSGGCSFATQAAVSVVMSGRDDALVLPPDMDLDSVNVGVCPTMILRRVCQAAIKSFSVVMYKRICERGDFGHADLRREITWLLSNESA